jgi:hypothetical protein
MTKGGRGPTRLWAWFQRTIHAHVVHPHPPPRPARRDERVRVFLSFSSPHLHVHIEQLIFNRLLSTSNIKVGRKSHPACMNEALRFIRNYPWPSPIISNVINSSRICYWLGWWCTKCGYDCSESNPAYFLHCLYKSLPSYCFKNIGVQEGRRRGAKRVTDTLILRHSLPCMGVGCMGNTSRAGWSHLTGFSLVTSAMKSGRALTCSIRLCQSLTSVGAPSRFLLLSQRAEQQVRVPHVQSDAAADVHVCAHRWR